MSQTVDKALRILELLGEGEMRLVDLAAKLDEHKSTVQRLLATMEARGFVRQDERTRRYSIGMKVLQLASRKLADLGLKDAAQESMQQLSDLTGETIHLAVYDEPHVVYVNKVESTFPVRMYSRVGARVEAYCTGVGKAMIAFLTSPELERYLRKVRFHPYTPHTIVDPDALRRELAAIRERGYALDVQEHEEGVQCVAAPVFGSDGKVIAAISVAAPAYRKSLEEIKGLAPAVVDACHRVSAYLGGVSQAIEVVAKE